MSLRNLVIVFGDQLNRQSAAFAGFDSSVDRVWMAEVAEENTHVWCHQQRITLFLSAMRHFRDALRSAGVVVSYEQLGPDPARDRGRSFSDLLTLDLTTLNPQRVIMLQPGDARVAAAVTGTLTQLGITSEIREDDHFLCSIDDFRNWAGDKRSLVMEFFYRWMRKRLKILIDDDGQPVGGEWNFDTDNRQSFGRTGPREIAAPMLFEPDAVTREVMQLVQTRFADHPGELHSFAWPVTRNDALRLLGHFIAQHLPDFGRWQDAMWTGQPFLNHSRLSAAINLKLLSPRECIDAAITAWHDGTAPLNSVEGFVRQLLGWREFVRGIYNLKMPEYITLNHLDATNPVPDFFWTGRTDMNCVKHAMQNVLQHGWTHHIERLMVLGNFAQLWGVHPRLFHDWHMAMYVDAIDWVSLPNTLGMSQFGDGGIMGSKPYCSTGNYISKMSNFCAGCRFDYRKRTGDDACPFTTLYWHFLDRHADQLASNGRLKFAYANLAKIPAQERAAIRARAVELESLLTSDDPQS